MSKNDPIPSLSVLSRPVGRHAAGPAPLPDLRRRPPAPRPRHLAPARRRLGAPAPLVGVSEMPDGSPSWQVLDVPPAPRRLSSPAAVGLVMLLTALSVAVASVAVQAVTGSAPFSMTLLGVVLAAFGVLGVVLHPDRPRQEEPGAESAADVVVEARLTREGGEAA